MLPLYLNLKATAPVRLEALRKAYADRTKATAGIQNARYHGLAPGSWRDVRYGKFTSRSYGLMRGSNGDAPVWYALGGEQFRSERDAHEVIRLRHTGYYTDTHGSETAVGIVAYLGKSRWLAGYRWTGDDERVYFQDSYDTENDAARAANEHARVFAEREREYCERAEAARALQDRIDAARERICELCAMRNMPRFPNARNELRERIQELRDLRESREPDHSDFI